MLVIYGMGIDCVEVARFKAWNTYAIKRLEKIFTLHELHRYQTLPAGKDYAQFFASRFAAKEAFYKALSSLLASRNQTFEFFSFEYAAPQVGVVEGKLGVPVLEVHWKAFEEKIGVSLSHHTIHLSLSHEKIMAIACVIIS